MARTHDEHVEALRRMADDKVSEGAQHARVVDYEDRQGLVAGALADELTLRYAAGWLERYGPDDTPPSIEAAADQPLGEAAVKLVIARACSTIRRGNPDMGPPLARDRQAAEHILDTLAAQGFIVRQGHT